MLFLKSEDSVPWLFPSRKRHENRRTSKALKSSIQTLRR